ncbi:RNA-binding KH domain-containing protein RCF3-like isoform X1 [Iris pallida]|nr:RNA-binding KH domain-containing protein RCF3-like isoform X1 [Iris pallida]
MIQSLRSATGANIRILKDGHLPSCANRNDELLQITGEATVVKEALLQVSSRLHASPSRMKLLPSTMSHAHLKGVHSRSKSSGQFDAVDGQTNNYSKYSLVDSTDSRGSKKRSSNDERPIFVPGPDDTFYRYLFPERKVGSLIGKGGEIVTQLRADSQAKIIVGEKVPGSEERVVTIFSSSEKTNTCEVIPDRVCPAQDALLRVHERLEAAEAKDDEHYGAGAPLAIVRLLVPADQTGHIIGKGGHIINDIQCDTHAHIRVLKDEHLPCANSNDEVLQISGEASDVKKALFQVSCCLYNRSSRLLNLTFHNDSRANPYQYHYDGLNVAERDMDTSSSKGFSLCLVCPSVNIGGVIGKGGIIINQIRQDSGALIKVDSSTVEDDCLILISAKEAILGGSSFFNYRCCSSITASMQ